MPSKHTPDATSEGVINSLKTALSETPETHLRVDQIIGVLGARSFGIGILIFALPMIIPMPPGIPMTSGLVICLFAFQLILGRQYLWLPNWIARKRISQAALFKAYGLADRYLGWVFRIARPRYLKITSPIAQRLSGVLFVILAVLMILPIPFIGNILPAFSCSILALGLSDRDGLIYLIGVAIALVSISLTLLMGFGSWRLLETFF